MPELWAAEVALLLTCLANNCRRAGPEQRGVIGVVLLFPSRR